MKIIILAGSDQSLINFRGELLRTLVALGHEVVAAAPAEDNVVPSRLALLGVRFVPLRLVRTGMNPLADWLARRDMEALLKIERPDIVLAYTIKPVIHGAIAAAKCGVPRIYALITGLGAAFNTPGLKGWLLSGIARLAYASALRRCTKVIVQNPEIGAFFLEKRILPDRQRLEVVMGSGVDLDRFDQRPIPSGPPVFLLIGRMLRDKGVMEFITAAQLVLMECPSAKFLLVGPIDTNPAAISREALERLTKQVGVEYSPATSDVTPWLARCTCYVLPSYHEGLPRTVLEAMATGRPVITTDVIGCRDTIIEAGPPDEKGIRMGRNGVLVPARDANSLALAMIRMAKNRILAEEMGHAGRKIAETRFDVRIINQQMLAAMSLSSPSMSLVPNPADN